jgi:hypothetical protein
MGVVGEGAALVIAGAGRRIAVNVMLDEAGATELAGDRQAQGDVLRGCGKSDGEAEEAQESKAHDRSATKIQKYRPFPLKDEGCARLTAVSFPAEA